MKHGRSFLIAGILLVSATLTACGGGSSDSVAEATSQDSSPVVSTRGANLHDAFSNTTAAAASATAAAVTSATRSTPATATTVAHNVPASTASSVASSLTLTWTAPDDNADGTPLVDLTGYKIRYGTASGNYSQTVTLSNAGLNRFVVDNLSSGTYYFTISAYNSAGTESQLSGELSTTI